MLLNRKLTKEEFYRLIEEAPESETWALRNFVTLPYYDFFSLYGKDWSGLVEDDRPVYVAMIDQENNLWTVANTNIKNPIKMFKESRKTLLRWVKEYGEITATMMKHTPKNIAWTNRIGLKQISEDDETITFSIKGD